MHAIDCARLAADRIILEDTMAIYFALFVFTFIGYLDDQVVVGSAAFSRVLSRLSLAHASQMDLHCAHRGLSILSQRLYRFDRGVRTVRWSCPHHILIC